MKIMKQYENEIKLFCEENELDFNKVKSFPKSYNQEVLFVQYMDKNKAKLGLLDNTPAEVVLTIKLNSDKTVSIEKGKNAEKYLAYAT